MKVIALERGRIHRLGSGRTFDRTEAEEGDSGIGEGRRIEELQSERKLSEVWIGSAVLVKKVKD
jgi:hypothetical protein